MISWNVRLWGRSLSIAESSWGWVDSVKNQLRRTHWVPELIVDASLRWMMRERVGHEGRVAPGGHMSFPVICHDVARSGNL